MVLRIVQAGNALPISWPVDPDAEFMPGMVGQLGSRGNNIVCGVSDGLAPIGLIDDIKTRAFTAPVVDEIVVGFVPEVARQEINGRFYTSIDIHANLANSNIMSNSFTSNPVDCELIPKNGVVIFPAGTELNFSVRGQGLDSIRTVAAYSYAIPNIPGDDSTLGNGKITIWFQRMVAQTDQFETNQRYPLNQNLFVSECGFLTTRQPSPEHPGVAIVTGSPSAIYPSLEFLWI